jgi:hypothetical protein
VSERLGFGRVMIGHDMVRMVAAAKAALVDADCRGENLRELVAFAVTELSRRRGHDNDVREVLRAHGHDPNGKRLADAVDEALRHAKAGK